MLSINILVAALAGVATALSGDLIIRTNPDGSCYSAEAKLHDSAHPKLVCLGNFECKSSPDGQIATVHQYCCTNGSQHHSDLYVFPKDTLQFCQKDGSCSCMKVEFAHREKENDYEASTYKFDDAKAWNC